MRGYDTNQHRTVQSAAKAVLAQLGPTIRPNDTEATLAARAASMLAALGFPDTWYYTCPAFVLLGSRSCVSLSGRDYVPSNEQVGEFNLVTVDLSPAWGDIWGDCARSFCIEDGRFTKSPRAREFVDGLAAEAALHTFLRSFVRPDMTFDELFRGANAQIAGAGFENLDFQANVGHSIEHQRSDRRFIERDNLQQLGDVAFFTFEPHIRRRAGKWGFKHEDIYFFTKDGTVEEL
jgi:Xaa-Pro aminopeptidase